MAPAFTTLVLDFASLRIDVELDPVALAVGRACLIATPFTLYFFHIAITRGLQFFMHLGDGEPLALGR